MKKIISFLLVLMIVFGFEMLSEYHIHDNKIEYETMDGIESLSVKDALDISTKLDKVSLIAKFNYDEFTYPEFDRDNSNYKDATMEEVNAYRDAKRRAGKAYHQIKNKHIFSSLNISNYNYAYICSLLPFVEITFEQDEYVDCYEEVLAKITSHRDVSKVIIRKSNMKNRENLVGAIGEAAAGEMYSSDNYTGDGVTVGILETGIVDSTNSILSNQSITYFNQSGFTSTVTEHATKVASIIGGKEGMAPEATLLSAAVNGNVYEEVEWMVNNGADIINMSYGETVPTGIYSSDSAFIDNMVKTYNVVAIAAVGNTGEGTGKVGNPALGYNVIGVGSADMQGDVCDFSAYNVVNGPDKPTIITSGYSMTIPGFGLGNSGTSFSAAFLSGMIALLLDVYPDLKTRTEMVIAMACASAYPTTGYNKTEANGFNYYNGAGRFHLKHTYYNYYRIWTFNNTGGYNGKLIYEFTAHMNSGYTLQTSFAWLASANVSSATASFNCYEGVIKNASGEIVASAIATRSNVLFMRYYVTSTQRYTMQIYQKCDAISNTDKLAFAYSFSNTFS